MKRRTVLGIIFLFLVPIAEASDKNGVSPQAISLPSGPGSIQGLGESFQPQLNSGSGSYSVVLQLPKGPAGFGPSLSLQYHTGNGNGVFGLGWRLSGVTTICRNIDHGLPLYVEAPNGVDDDFDGVVDNPGEIDRYSGVDLEELVPLADGTFRSESESRFLRYERTPSGWLTREKKGIAHEFGATPSARIEDNSRVFAWLLDRTTDLHGNAVEYRYVSDVDSPGQKYCKEIRWPAAPSFYAVVISYDHGRPDVYSDFRSGFEVRTAQRVSRIDVIAQGVPVPPGALTGDFNDDGVSDFLIRRYVLEYAPDTLQSLLSRIILIGADGVTALPPITFDYTGWQPLDDVAATITQSSGDPPAALDSDNVELIDMNQDGLPDLLQATTSSHQVHVNLGMDVSGKLAWDAVGVTIQGAPSLNLGSTTVHLADHSADGEADLIHKVNDTTFQCFLNSGHLSWSGELILGNTDSWPKWPFENADSRTLDADHNRMNDILFTSDNSYRLWMLMSGGRYGREISIPVLSDGTGAFGFHDPGARVADVNGDRISDLAWIQSTRVVYWASCGRGNFDGPIMLPLSGTLSAQDITHSDFADVNGDALADLIVVRPAASPNGIQYYLNRGQSGFDTVRTILGLPAVQTGDTVRFADMNGNGSVDFLISNSNRPTGTREQFLDFVPGIRPHLLRRVDNGLGLVTTMEYETSVTQMIRARDQGTPWTSSMPMSIPLVARITEDDGRGDLTVREFDYANPFYDPKRQEFRGFSNVVAHDLGDNSIPTRTTKYEFDTGAGAECRKGMILSRDVSDATGTHFERIENTLQDRVVGTSADGQEVCFAFNATSDLQVYEQTANPVIVRTEIQVDDFGNALVVDQRGVADTEGDETHVENTFAYHPDIWLMDRRSHATTRNRNGEKVAESLFEYDEFGDLIERQDWLDTGDRYISAVRREYDDFGNVITMIDANDHSRSIAYDDVLHVYPLSEAVHLQSYDLITTAAYDMGQGKVTAMVDFAGATTSLEYDALGRPVAIRRPGGAETRYAYKLGSPISRIITSVREQLGGGTFDTYTYTDGLGRGLGSKIEAEDGQWRFVDAVTFNSRKLPRQQWLPYFTSGPDYEAPDPTMPKDTMAYDAQGRRVQTIHPDGTETRTDYGPLTRTEHDENDMATTDTPLVVRIDGLGRVVEVTEARNSAQEGHTHYTWNTLGSLTDIVDAHGNRKSMTYDSLRRNASLHDPDRGSLTYEYDDVGNLLLTTDASARQVAYTYDYANRLVTENYLDQGGGQDDTVDVRYVYDIPAEDVDFGDGQSATATFTGGRLSSVEDLSGQEYRSYDARGNPVWVVKRILDPLLGVATSFRTGFAYDTMDRITSVDYPDGDRCGYTYNEASFLETAGGGAGGQIIVASASYDPTGRPTEFTFGNGVVTTSSYDDRDRLSALQTVSPEGGDLIHYGYTYDPASNITRIDDLRPQSGSQAVPVNSPRRNTQSFQYDDLYQLTQVKYAPADGVTPDLGQLDYSYDRIGNMLRQSTPAEGEVGHLTDAAMDLGLLTIGGTAGTENRVGRLPGDPPGPHALSAAQHAGTSEYDDNGNTTETDGATLYWDFKNRLVRYRRPGAEAKYVYDYSDRRTVKLVTARERVERTFYVNPNFEDRPGNAPTKYVFDADRRLAKVTGTLDPGRMRVQRIRLVAGWNLLTIAVQTSQIIGELFGQDAQVYEWTGTDYRPVATDSPVPIGVALWVDAATARVVAVRGAYLPPMDPLVIPAGQMLVAWPRLQPFVPERHVSTPDAQIQALDPQQLHWLLREKSLPAGVAENPDFLASAGAMWLTAPSQRIILPESADARTVVFYHGDHLGSASVVTDHQGALVKEIAFYPFGGLRNMFEPGAPAHEPYGFAQKEQDEESRLQYFEARCLAGAVGRFISPDPKYGSPGMLLPDELQGYLSQPRKANLYAYVQNNPLNRTDPTGQDDDSICSLIDTAAEVSDKTSSALDFLEYSRATNLAESANITVDAARDLTAFKVSPVVGKIATGLGIASNAVEAYEFIKDPTVEKGAHLGGTTAITIGGFISGPGAAIAATAQATYDSSPTIHQAANAAGDWAASLPGGTKVSGGIVASEVSVGLTLVKVGAMAGAGAQGAEGFDRFLSWVLD
ncbi:MAG: VCBS repeat-containing protein [Phycisphaerae bacterium]|nr:VCBS repeat-containing protein [Phycisphaerae bacterium]